MSSQKLMPRCWLTLFTALSAGFILQHAAAAQSAANADRSAERLAATCANCHGTNGVRAGDALPSLAGQSEQVLLASLKDFKSGARSATIMHQIAKGYSEQQLAQLAAYFAAQKKEQ